MMSRCTRDCSLCSPHAVPRLPRRGPQPSRPNVIYDRWRIHVFAHPAERDRLFRVGPRTVGRTNHRGTIRWIEVGYERHVLGDEMRQYRAQKATAATNRDTLVQPAILIQPGSADVAPA